MEPVNLVTGRAIPLDRSDVDTDQIIESDWLRRIERTGYGEGLFSVWRKDPGFVFNRPEYRGATILVTGPNFGIGSSREHAVWALVDYGIKAVVSPRIADIFKNNSTRSGLVPVVVETALGRQLLEAAAADPGLEITVDVDRRMISAAAIGVEAPFSLDDEARARLLGGLDDIALTLEKEEAIARFEENRPSFLPRLDPPARRLPG